jgi:uncharacterized protein YndB with AHSA1/START domain
MPHAENTVTIDRPIADVFAYLADGRNNAHWRPGVVEIAPSSEHEGPGATYRQVTRGPGGQRIAADYRVTLYSPPRELGFQVIAGPARPTGHFRLTEAGAGRTSVTFSLDLKPTGLIRLMSGMVARTMRTEVGHLGRLKTELERRDTG